MHAVGAGTDVAQQQGMPRPASVTESLLSSDAPQDGTIASGGPNAESKLAPRTASRITGYVFSLPALANRREDIGLFVACALRKAKAEPKTRFERPAARALLRYSWPGNLPELRESIRHAIAVAGTSPIEPAHLPHEVVESEKGCAQRSELIALLRTHHGSVSAVGRAMQLSRIQVHRLATKLAVDIHTYRNR